MAARRPRRHELPRRPPAGAKGQRNGNNKIDERTVQMIRDLARLDGLATQREIAAHFRIAQSTVSDIIAGRIWTDLPDEPLERQLAYVGPVLVFPDFWLPDLKRPRRGKRPRKIPPLAPLPEELEHEALLGAAPGALVTMKEGGDS